MRRVDELHLNHPFAGARMLSKMLKREGSLFGRRRVSTLMKRMESTQSIASPIPASGVRRIQSIRICCGICPSHAQTMSGQQISRTSQ